MIVKRSVLKLWLYSSILLFGLLSACSEKQDDEVRGVINPDYQVELVRFDQALMQLDIANIKEASENLENRYPDFTYVWSTQVMPMADQTLGEFIVELRQDTGFAALQLEVDKVYADLYKLEPSLSQAIENYNEVFDNKTNKVGRVYTFVSGFAYQSFVFDDSGRDGIGLGLDMFLGNDFPYHTIDPKNPAFSFYITRAFNRDHLVKKMVEVLVEDKLAAPSGDDFLAMIIWGGKKLFVMDQILDFTSDTVIIEYTTDQLAWCRENEEEMWQFFFDKDLFHSTDFRSFNKLIAPAPTSPGMPEVSPGRTGNYMGWQIIKAYMQRHPRTSITELLQLDDAQEILDGSRFRPG